jgi:hypothetical protein
LPRRTVRPPGTAVAVPNVAGAHLQAIVARTVAVGARTAVAIATMVVEVGPTVAVTGRPVVEAAHTLPEFLPTLAVAERMRVTAAATAGVAHATMAARVTTDPTATGPSSSEASLASASD